MAASEKDDDRPYVRVQVIDVEIPFMSMVWLLVKVALAAIPAALIIALFIVGAGAIIGLLDSF